MRRASLPSELWDSGCDLLLRDPAWLVANAALPEAIRALSKRRILGLEGFFYDTATGTVTPDMDSIADFAGLTTVEAREAAERVAAAWRERPIFVEFTLADSDSVAGAQVPSRGREGDGVH